METNQLIMTGIVTDLKPVRYSPAGIPQAELILEHRSRQREAGYDRQALCIMTVRLAGDDLLKVFQTLVLGQKIKVSGFLTRSHYKDSDNNRPLLHAQLLEVIATH